MAWRGRRFKHGNKWTEVDGIKFQSKLEAKMYGELKLLQKAGNIKDLKLQVPFTLQEGYTRADGKKIRPIKYVADFTFYDNDKGRFRVLDSKGYRTPLYKIKRKIFDYIMKDEGLCLEEEI